MAPGAMQSPALLKNAGTIHILGGPRTNEAERGRAYLFFPFAFLFTFWAPGQTCGPENVLGAN